MSQVVRVGRKNAIYLPKGVTEALGVEEGDRLRVAVKDNAIIMRPLPRLFAKRRCWASTTVEEFEAESEGLVEGLEREG
jgi:AbrB family looped-hinge helix DNA binding protein